MKEPTDHPLAHLTWVQPTQLFSNDYNPNKVFPPELALLKVSILENGWTQPIVARTSGEIVDGFHRWSLASRDAEVRALTGGVIPVVYLDDAVDRATQIMSTVRHNRARGAHGVLRMSSIVRELRAVGMDEASICERLGMEPEEVARLSDVRAKPERVGKESYGRGWVPEKAPEKS